MPHPWALVDSSFPTFTGEENPREQIGQIVEYMMLLTEALKYQLENLSSSNWNSTALKDMQADTTESVEQANAALSARLAVLANEMTALTVRVNSLDGYADGLGSKLEELQGRTEQLETDVSYLEKFQEEAEKELEQMNSGLGNVEAAVGELEEAQVQTEKDVESLEQAQTETAGKVATLAQQQEQTDSTLEQLSGGVSVDASGNATVGGTGKNVYLNGNVYINGVLYEEAETE